MLGPKQSYPDNEGCILISYDQRGLAQGTLELAS